jgi:hypothetical protein
MCCRWYSNSECILMITRTVIERIEPKIDVEKSSMGTEDGKGLHGNEPLIRISRQEAGLDIIPAVNFNKFELNDRIHEILLEGKPYSHSDMKNGIIAPYFITERFKQPIIDRISIGTSIDEVINILGTPALQTDYIVAYKTSGYYISFYGNEYVELVNFAINPAAHQQDILKPLLNALCIENVYLMDF